MQDSYPCYVGGEAAAPNQDLEVVDKWTGEVATRVPLVDAATIDRAIGLADAAAEPMREMAAYERQAVLDHCVARFTERREELAQALCVEAGKPIKDARGEATRLIDTFRVAAEESTRIYGEVMPLDISPRARGYRGMWKRVPIGPCSFISPFNFPLNLAAHKVAPTLHAAGHFGVPAFVPVLLNVSWIVGAWIVAPQISTDKATQAYILAVCILIGGALQLGVQLPVLYGLGFRFDYDFSACRDSLHRIMLATLPMIAGLAATQINTLADSLIAWGFSAPPDDQISAATTGYPMQAGAAAAIYYGERLYQFPLGSSALRSRP